MRLSLLYAALRYLCMPPYGLSARLVYEAFRYECVYSRVDNGNVDSESEGLSARLVYEAFRFKCVCWCGQ